MTARLVREVAQMSGVPFDPNVTQADVARTIELSQDFELRRADQAAAARRTQQELFEAATRRRAEIFGADGAFALQQFQRSLRYRDALQQAAQGRLDPIEAAAARRRELADYLKDHDINRTQFDEYLKDMRKIFKPASLPDWAGQSITMDYGGFPVPAVPTTSHFTPPFMGWQHGSGAGLVSGFRVNATALLDANAGQVGNVVKLDDAAASDLDAGSMSSDTQIAFWYRVPTTGLVEVTINAICGKSLHSLRVYDEWGVSWSGVTQTASFMSHVLHPNVAAPTYSFLSRLDHDKDTSTSRDETPFWPGQYVQSSPMVSDGAVPAGTDVVIRAGAHSSDGALTNDMEVHSASTHSWFISRVDVRVLA